MSVFRDTPFVHYEARLEFTGRLIGGAPSDPKLVEGWLIGQAGVTDEEQLQRWTMTHLAEVHGVDPATATYEEIEAAIADNAIEKKAQVFKRMRTDNRPYVEPRHVNAMLKEATSIGYPKGEVKWGKYRNDKKGVLVGGKDPKSWLAERVAALDTPIVVADDVDGIDLYTGHIPDFRSETGRRATLGYFEFCERPVLTFVLRVLDDCVTPEQWNRIWQIAGVNGLGARRSQGAGQFVVTKFERIDGPSVDKPEPKRRGSA